ncbi:MAG: Slp family lipoprotein [Leptospirales bacterium]
MTRKQQSTRTGQQSSTLPGIWRGLLWTCSLALLGGCGLFDSPPFSKQETHWADRAILFRDVVHHPRSLEGQHVVLGGRMINITRKGLISTIVVKEYPLGKELHPDASKPSLGIFEIVTDEFLPKDRYQPGRKVEVIGTVIRPVWLKTAGGQNTLVPVIRGRHVHASSPPPPPMPMDMMDPGMMGPGMMYPGMMGPGMMPGFY